MILREIAFSRSGDKGDIANVSVIPYDSQDWDFVREHVTADRVKSHFGGLILGEVRRYELPGIRALNFVMSRALDGGVSLSLRIDPHGKSFQSHMLALPLPVAATTKAGRSTKATGE